MMGIGTINAQVEIEAQDYTYQTDRTFHYTSELFNFPFYPYMYEKGEQKINCGIGQVEIMLMQGFLMVKGLDGINNFNVIATTEKRFGNNFGFESNLIDANDAAIEATLKIITDEYAFPLAIILESKSFDPYILHLKNKTDVQAENEYKYFTRRAKVKARTYEDLRGKSILPFHYVNDMSQSLVIERVSVSDSTFIRFSEEMILVVDGDDQTNYEIKGIEYFNSKIEIEDSPIQWYIEIKLKTLDGSKKGLLTLYFTGSDKLYSYELGTQVFYLMP